MERFATTVMWVLALVFAAGEARYFLRPAPMMVPVELLALARHHFLLLTHIACGIVALVLGPMQFLVGLRQRRPMLHRYSGRVYVVAVMFGGALGLVLTPDTPLFLAQGSTDAPRLLSSFGIDPSWAGMTATSRFVPAQFFAAMLGFGALSLAWMFTGAMAFLRARQRRFQEHRAWMVRNYALTFAGVSVRFASALVLFALRMPILAAAMTFWSWTVNLVVAEWLLRRRKLEVTITHARAATAGD